MLLNVIWLFVFLYVSCVFRSNIVSIKMSNISKLNFIKKTNSWKHGMNTWVQEKFTSLQIHFPLFPFLTNCLSFKQASRVKNNLFRSILCCTLLIINGLGNGMRNRITLLTNDLWNYCCNWNRQFLQLHFHYESNYENSVCVISL